MTSTFDEPINEGRLSRRVNVAVGGTLIAVLLLVVGTPAVLNASNTSDQIQRGDEITSCRAQKNAVVVDATAELNRQRVRNDLLLNRFLDALLNEDDAAVAELRPAFAPIRRAMASADSALEQANEEYQHAVDLSIEDPDELLRQCRLPRSAAVTTTTAEVTPITGVQGAEATTSTTARKTAVSRPRSTSTTGTTSTTVYRSSPAPTPTPTAPPSLCDLIPVSIPREIPCR